MKRTASLTVALVVALGLAASGRQQVGFRSAVGLVRLDVLVMDKGRAVHGLRADDFEVLDNGVRQQVQLVTDDPRITVLPVLDTSASVAGATLRQLVEATRSVFQGLRPSDRTGLITFSEHVALRVPLQDAVTGLGGGISSLDSLAAGGRTAMYDALFSGLALAMPEAGRSLVVLYSDGEDSASWLTSRAVREAATQAGVVVYAVFPDSGDPSLPMTERMEKVHEHEIVLDSLVAGTGGRVFRAATPQLHERFDQVLSEFRARYLLAFEPEGVRHDDGWHDITVRVRTLPSAVVKVRSGYVAGAR